MTPIKIIIFIFLFLSIHSLKCQGLLVPVYSATNPSAPGLCDGTITIDSMENGAPPYVYTLHYGPADIVSTCVPVFSNLCEGGNTIYIYDGNCNFGQLTVFMETVTGNQSPLVLENISIIPESNPGACNGSLDVQINNFSNGMTFAANDIFPNSIWYNGNITSNSFSMSGICMSDSLGNVIGVSDVNQFFAEYFTLNQITWTYADPSLNCFALNLWVDTYYSQDSLNCTGKANSTIWGGIPPYIYSFSTGDTTSSINNICPGVYSLQVTDALGDTASTTFVISDSSHFYQSGFFIDPTDTLFTNALQNCDLDYTQPIDSVYLDTLYFINAYDMAAEFIIVQDTMEFLFSEIWHVDTFANFALSISYYCDNRSLYDTYTILTYLPLRDLMTVGIPQIKREEKLEAKIYPNPSVDRFNLSFSSIIMGDYTISISDISGKIISTKIVVANFGTNVFEFDISALESGIYIVDIAAGNRNLQSLKLVKD